MPSIIIKRSDEWNNRNVSFNIIIDGVKKDRIENAGSREIFVAPGKHTLKLSVQWAGSSTLTFDVQGNEVRTYEVSGNSPLNLIIMGMLLGCVVMSAIYPDTLPVYFLVISIVASLAFMVKFVIIDRKRYLKLKCTDPLGNITHSDQIF